MIVVFKFLDMLPIGYRIKIFCKREKLALDFGRESSAAEKNISEIWQLSPQVRAILGCMIFERAIQCYRTTAQKIGLKSRHGRRNTSPSTMEAKR